MHGRHERWRGRLVVLQWVVSQLEGLMTFVGGCVCETWSWKNCSWFIVRYLRNMDLIASCSFLGPSQPTLPQLPSHYSLHLISQILTQIYMGYRIYQLMDAPTLKNENLAGSWISFILGHPSRKAREHPWFQSACYISCELGFQLVFIISCWHSISIIAQRLLLVVGLSSNTYDLSWYDIPLYISAMENDLIFRKWFLSIISPPCMGCSKPLKYWKEKKNVRFLRLRIILLLSFFEAVRHMYMMFVFSQRSICDGLYYLCNL